MGSRRKKHSSLLHRSRECQVGHLMVILVLLCDWYRVIGHSKGSLYLIKMPHMMTRSLYKIFCLVMKFKRTEDYCCVTSLQYGTVAERNSAEIGTKIVSTEMYFSISTITALRGKKPNLLRL